MSHRKDPNWLANHKSLYGDNGKGTEDLKRMQEQTQRPQGPSVAFPIIRISNRAQRMLSMIRNAAYDLGRIEQPHVNREEVEHAYARLQKSRKELCRYIEQLEYQAGIARDTLLRF